MNQTEAVSLTLTQAHATLADRGVRSAHLVSAVMLGIRSLEEHMKALSPEAPRLQVLFSAIDASRVQFALFTGHEESATELCAYEYNPNTDVLEATRLYRTDGYGNEIGSSALTRQLLPMVDFALARMEEQIWRRVRHG